MSNWEGPPTMKSTMLCLAFGGKIGEFRASGAVGRAKLLFGEHARETEETEPPG